MKRDIQIHLPGSNRQIGLLLGNVKAEGKDILVIGAGSEEIAKIMLEEGAKSVELIVPDYESLMNSNLVLENFESITAKMMEFEITDYEADKFDIIYAQASISSERRNKIVKEMKRIIKQDGILCDGEIVKLKPEVPPFVQNIFDVSDLDPLYYEEIEDYFECRGWKVLDKQDYSKSLKEYYSINLKKLETSGKELSDREKSYHKKLMNKISHQSKAYLKQGGDEFIGFYAVIAKTNK